MKFDIKNMTDAHKLIFSCIITFAVLQAVFFAENVFTTLKTVSVLFWLFVLPGIGITYLWDLDFIERLPLSVAISAAVVGITSYYLGLAGIDVKASSVILPAVCITIGLLVIFRNKIKVFKPSKK